MPKLKKWDILGDFQTLWHLLSYVANQIFAHLVFKKMFDMKVLILLTLFSLSQAQNCCSRLRFDSTGNLADSGQNHIIGNYIYISDGPDGYWNYEQEEPNQFGNKMKLYYYPPVGVWYFGDDLDTNMGYALNKGDAQCPEGTVFENHSKCRIGIFHQFLSY